MNSPLETEADSNRKKGYKLFYQARDMRSILPQQIGDISDIDHAMAYAHLA